MPDSGRAVVIAHSLGFVVAADVVKRLSPRLQIDGLITIGSPLPLRGRWPFVELTGDDFPYDQVRSWVNVFDSLDPVTGGRGVGRLFPEALDVDVHFGTLPSLVRNHGVQYYLSLRGGRNGLASAPRVGGRAEHGFPHGARAAVQR
ncbi:hypothetical protein G5V58_18390 [Nocardioides anomalus]|uniref:Alpha/beta hydrolase n=1 Tax=Nocardioides anomalus TaxID=2712223 RepID=A0A6G6WGZ9_9ACTN|nr:hypothetical protein [Nocardioides anomalus]QIG44489.1 hypothetical protein G5V58_18390 [Nocardioides anomalus]